MMTVPIFDMPLEWRAVSMVMGGVDTTKEMAEESNVSIREIEDLKYSKLLIPPMNLEASRNGNPDNLGSAKWMVSDTGSLVAEAEEIPRYPGSIGQEKYFDDTRFVPEWLAKDILNNIRIRTMFDNGEMFFYNGGIYRQKAERVLQWYVRKMLGPLSTRNRENEVIAHINSVTPIKRENFNSVPEMINLKNGIYDIRDGLFRPHDKNILMTVQLPVNYNKNAKCPTIEKFVSEIVDPKDIPIIQEIFGYCLLRDYRFHKIFMMLGEGSNGKSTLLELLKRFLGKNNISSIPLQDLEFKRFSMAGLYGKLANIYPDLPDASLKQTGKMKALCGGDTVSVEKKFKDHFSFMNFAKLIFSANKLPEAYDDSDAFFRRWIIIQFPNQFIGDDRDVRLLDKLTTDDELSGCLNWAIVGLNRLIENGCFSNECNISDMRREYRKLSSPIAAFSEARLEEDPEGSITKEDMYATFVQFCKKERLIPVSKSKFGRDFVMQSGLAVREGNTKIFGKNTKVWQNVRLI